MYTYIQTVCSNHIIPLSTYYKSESETGNGSGMEKDTGSNDPANIDLEDRLETSVMLEKHFDDYDVKQLI